MGDFETTTTGVLANAGLTPPEADDDNVERHAMEHATINRALFGRRAKTVSTEAGAFSLDLASNPPGAFSVTLTADATFAGFTNWASGELHAAEVLIDLDGNTLTLPSAGWTWHTLDGSTPSAANLASDVWSFLAVSSNDGASVDAYPLTGMADFEAGDYGYLVDYGFGLPSGAPSTLVRFYVNYADGVLWHWNGAAWLRVSAYPTHFGNMPIVASPAAVNLNSAAARGAYTITLAANGTLSFSDWKTGDEQWASITVVQDATGGWTFDLSAVDEWPDGEGSTKTTPVMPSAANAEMQFTVMSRDNGVTVYGWRIR